MTNCTFHRKPPSQNGMVLLLPGVAFRDVSSANSFNGKSLAAIKGVTFRYPLLSKTPLPKRACKCISRFTFYTCCLFLILVDIFLLFFWYCCRLLYWTSWHIPDVFDNVSEKVDTPFQYKAHRTIPPTPGGGTSSIFLRNPALKI